MALAVYLHVLPNRSWTFLLWADFLRRAGRCVRFVRFVQFYGLWFGHSLAGNEDGRLFHERVWPLLEAKCVQCHGAEKQKGGLRLDSREALLRGGDGGAVVHLGDPSKGSLMRAVRYRDEELQMPPKEPLSAEEVAVLGRWISAGAPWPQPVAVLYEDGDAIFGEFRSGNGRMRLVTDDVHSGASAMGVTALQREAAKIPGWNFEIRETPNAGQYRFLRFAWRKRGGGSALLEIASSGRWPDAKVEKGRYVSGPNTTGWAAVAVSDEAPMDWTVVICDLWKDMGDFTFTGIAPTCDKGEEVLFDGVVLGRDRESVQGYVAGSGVASYVDPNRRVGNAWEDAENPVRKIWRGERLDLWSFRKPKRPEVPIPAPKHPIDAFLETALMQRGMCLSRQAEPAVLLRRLKFDLLGLPPEDGEVERFEAACVRSGFDESYRALVERYLADPAYGERWARHWLDVVRYADTNGHERDEFRPDMWRYRDYVVDAFRSDKRYDRFVWEQVAGDLVLKDPKGHPEEPAQIEAVVGSGFLRLGLFDSTAPIFQEQRKAANEWMADVVNTTGSAFLGLTLSCCNCHDHKYDPLTQADHFRFRALFSGMTARDDVSVESPDRTREILRVGADLEERAKALDTSASAELEPARERIRGEKIAKLPEDVRALFERPEAQWDAATKKRVAPHLDKIKVSEKEALEGSEEVRRKEHGRLKKEAESFRKEKPSFAKAVTVSQGNPESVRLFFQGDYTEPREEVAPGFLTFFSPSPVRLSGGSGGAWAGRSALADWIVSEDNPFTARVMVNRLWMHHFGRPIFSNPNDLGFGGGKPLHPELLDWLAVEFRESGWSVKAMHRLMVTSRAYQQSSAERVEAVGADPDNTLMWRQNVRRLDAETMRDAMLAVSGLLRQRVGGRPVWPPLPEELLRAQPGVLEALEGKDSGRRQGWFTDKEEDCDVRSIYLVQKRTVPIPFLQVFDVPDTAVSCARRDVTTVAPQALNLLNSDFTLRAARAMEKAWAGVGEDGEFVRRAIRRAFGRAATGAEVASGATFVRAAGSQGRVEYCRALLNANEFVYID
ncbi:MAG: hypothetical protein RIS92_1294 [Verrucomicrobiota bacterium]